MSTELDWAEDARIERARLRERPDPQTGFLDAADEFYDDEPEDEEPEELEE